MDYLKLKERVDNKASEYFDYVVKVRRHLHQYPELSFEEFNTAAFIRAELDKIGVEYTTMANTGVVAILKGNKPSDKVIALRADMDALPIMEITGREYGSQNQGVMHACGHDAHIASLLGVVHILSDLKEYFGGIIKFIFQPAEEKIPGGASLLIKEGVLTNPEPVAVIGQHVMPLIEVGKVGFRSGKYMASSDELYLTVYGQGGHGAQPHQNIDPIAITAQIISALQQVVSRFADPRIPTVLSWGKIIGDGTTNVIPDKVILEGTFRTFDEEWREKAHKHIEKITKGVAESMGARCDIEIRKGYPVLNNEPILTAQNKSFAEEFLGVENVLDLDLWTAAEDFAYYSQVLPSCFYRLGTGNAKKGITAAVHTPIFDIDEDALLIGMGLMSYIALRQLG